MKFDFSTIQLIFGSLDHPFQLGRAILCRLAKRTGIINEAKDSVEDQKKDRILPFNEYPLCEMCNSNSVSEKLVTMDDSHIVECDKCGLWFTSPRIEETLWSDYLKTNTERNIEFTENRLKYGCALSANKKYTFPGWKKVKKREHDKIFDTIEMYLGRSIERVHDVGCGVGLLIQDAVNRDMVASGNELNIYAYTVMKERLGLDVYNETLPCIGIKEETLDAVVMRDYIEHTYNPLADLKAAFALLKQDGIIYVETFHIDCATFDRLKGSWNMLFWNHVYHFSKKSLEEMIKTAGFKILDVKTDYNDVLIEIIAQKQ